MLDLRSREAFNAQPTSRAANIPLEELADRPFELPPPSETVDIADTGIEAHEGAAILRQAGRIPQIVPSQTGTPNRDRFRLWKATSLLDVSEALPPARALCLACGVGREAVILAAAGWQVVATDVLPDAIERGRRLEDAYLPPDRPQIRWLVADLREALPADLGEFDLVTQFFYSDTSTAARTMGRLAPRGVALIEAFSEQHWSSLGRLKPERVLRTDAWPSTYEVRCDEDWHQNRHTTRIVVRRS